MTVVTASKGPAHRLCHSALSICVMACLSTPADEEGGLNGGQRGDRDAVISGGAGGFGGAASFDAGPDQDAGGADGELAALDGLRATLDVSVLADLAHRDATLDDLGAADASDREPDVAAGPPRPCRPAVDPHPEIPLDR